LGTSLDLVELEALQIVDRVQRGDHQNRSPPIHRKMKGDRFELSHPPLDAAVIMDHRCHTVASFLQTVLLMLKDIPVEGGLQFDSHHMQQMIAMSNCEETSAGRTFLASCTLRVAVIDAFDLLGTMVAVAVDGSELDDDYRDGLAAGSSVDAAGKLLPLSSVLLVG
jgi:hypothetical protein